LTALDINLNISVLSLSTVCTTTLAHALYYFVNVCMYVHVCMNIMCHLRTDYLIIDNERQATVMA